MPARRLFEVDPPSLPLRVYSPAERRSDTRITQPGVGAGARADLAAIYASVRDEHQEDSPEISPADHAACRASWGLQRFYDVVLSPWRRRQLGRGEVKPGTLQKERQALGCYDAWDQQQQPERWPAGNIWRGLPCSFLAGHWFERWATDRLESLAVDTVESRWCAVRTVLNGAIRLGVTEAVAPNLSPLFDRKRELMALDGEYDEFVATTYTVDQVEAIYLALAGEPDLQTAWLLGAVAGPRTVDLFSMRWGVNIKIPTPGRTYGEMFYTARKTGKKHWVPLPLFLVAHLRRLAQAQGHLVATEPEGLVFPRLTAGASKDPEKSRAARARNDRLKLALASVGLPTDEASDFHKPIQVLRATCNSRLNNHRAGKGLLVTHGKDADVSSRHYWDERDSLIEAVLSLPWPNVFSKGVDCGNLHE